MKTLLLILFMFITSIYSTAQPVDSRGMYNYNDIENVDMGWMEPLKITKPATAFSKNGWHYTDKQVEISQQIALWVEQTFRTVGLLGSKKMAFLMDEGSKYRGTKDYDYNEREKDAITGLPNSYGAKAQFHFCVSKVKDRRFWPTPGNWCQTDLYIMANNIGLISEQVVALNSTNDYFFLMPKYTLGEKGRNDNEAFVTMANYRNFTNSSNLKNYTHYLFPKDRNISYIIIMTKDGKPLPVEQVTIGGFLNQLEKQLPQMIQLAQNRKLIYENYVENAKKGIIVLRELLKSKLNQHFYTVNNYLQIDITHIANIGSSGKLPVWIKTEATTNEGYTNMPLWQLKKGVKESLATAGPEWIIFKLDAPINSSYEGSIRLMDDFVNRFNYEYVYNYFWGKGKVTTPYKPTGFVDEQVSNNNQPTTEKSAMVQRKAADKNVVLFEDFSAVPAGASPPHWQTGRSEITGNSSQVVSLNNQGGKWLKLIRNATPKNNTFSGIADFEYAADVLVHKGDVPYGATELETEFTLSTPMGEKIFRMNVTPGNMNQANAEGWLTLSVPNSSNCKTSNYYYLPYFKGSMEQSKINIALTKRAESLTVLCNDNKIFQCDTYFPPNTTLKKFSLISTEKSQYYVSNIELKKL